MVDGSRVVVGGADGRVHVGDGSDAGRPVRAIDSAVSALALSPLDPVVAAGGEGEVALLDVRFGERLLRHTLDGGRVGALVFSPDGRWLAAASADGLVRLVATDASVWQPLDRAHDGELTAAAWLPEGLVVGGRDGRLVRW